MGTYLLGCSVFACRVRLVRIDTFVMNPKLARVLLLFEYCSALPGYVHNYSVYGKILNNVTGSKSTTYSTCDAIEDYAGKGGYSGIFSLAIILNCINNIYIK